MASKRDPVTRAARLLGYGLAVLIVAALLHEAIEAAGTLGWIAYPIVLGSGLASFLLARLAWDALTDWMAAEIRRERRRKAG